MHTLSFTGERQVRFPAPDVARGFMLALIALANVPFWLRYFPDAPHAGEAALTAMNDADQWWYLVRTLFVDRRAYPLFSILFGFGMAIMASRTIERERRVAMDAIPPELSAGWNPLQREIVRDAVERRARRAAARLIRRRGWWMLAFGLVHGIFFAGDIIGAYGLVAVIFAEVIVMRRAWLRVLIGAFIASLSMLGIWSMAAMAGREPMVFEFHDPVQLDAGYPLVSLASWLIATPMTVLTALVVPCVMIGVGVARWGAAAGSARARAAPGWHRACGPGDRCSGGRSLRPHAAGLGFCRVGVLVVSALPRFRRCGSLRVAGAPCTRGRRSARESRLGMRVPERDRSPFDDRLLVTDAALYCYVRRAWRVRRSCPGGCGFGASCAGGLGADWLRLCDRRGRGNLSWSRGVGAALAGCQDRASAARPGSRIPRGSGRSRGAVPGLTLFGVSHAACRVLTGFPRILRAQSIQIGLFSRNICILQELIANVIKNTNEK